MTGPDLLIMIGILIGKVVLMGGDMQECCKHITEQDALTKHTIAPC